MKIYYASQSFYPHIGGVPTYLLNLCKEMVNLGNEVIEVHLRPSGEESYEEIEGIKVHRVPREPIDKGLMQEYSQFKEAVYKGSHYNTKGNNNIEDWDGFTAFNKINEFFGESIKKQLEIEPADIVHIHDFQLLYAYKYVPRGTPLILTWHIPFVKDMHPALKAFLIKHLSEYDKVVFSSEEYIEAAVKAGFPMEKTELIHPIANTNLFKKLNVNKEKTRERYKLPIDAKIIISAQRVDPKSGHEQLIRALPIIKKKIPNAKLVFVGGDSLSNKLSKSRAAIRENIDKLIKELKLEQDVIFTGTVDYYKMPEVYNAADINALCSKNEGFGLAVTEGMACGLPVIGTNVGGIPLQVKDDRNGYLVSVGDYQDTADKIIKILSDEELQEKMGEESLKVVEEEFGINVGIEKHAALYNTLMTEKDEFHKLEFLNKEDFKAIITDLDRTITDRQTKEEFTPEDYDKDLLHKLRRVGLDLFLATGRNLAYCKKLANKFKIWKAIICENGAVIYFPEGKKTITTSTYHMRRAKKSLIAMNLPGTKKGKIMVRIKQEQEEAARAILGKLADKIDFSKNVDEYIIVPKGVNKGLGVRQAMLYLNIDLDKTLCIGDGENDMDMFLNPGFKIALSNSHSKLKELSHQVTKNPSTKGMYEIIEKLSNHHS